MGVPITKKKKKKIASHESSVCRDEMWGMPNSTLFICFVGRGGKKRKEGGRKKSRKNK